MPRKVSARFEGPSRCVYASQVRELKNRLATMTDRERGIVAEIDNSRFAHPVLFISHRWETREHPDVSGRQLRKLKALKKCYIIYDYSSFPQVPRTADEQNQFDRIIASMEELVRNVVVLDSPDYLTRGWLVYEYLVACLRMELICDEVRAPDFVALRDWTSTRPGIPTNIVRDSTESQQTNYVNHRILEHVNRVVPLYTRARFQTEHDHSAVTGLLIEALKSALPSRKEYQPYVGEYTYANWTNEELARAFVGELEMPTDPTFFIPRFQVDVPSSVDDAVLADYQVSRPGWRELLGLWYPAFHRSFSDQETS
jgi:hypothetical protein